MENRQQIVDTLSYLCEKGEATYDKLAPVKDRTSGPGPKLKFIESFVGACMQMAREDLKVLAVKSAAEKTAEEAEAKAKAKAKEEAAKAE